MRTPSIVRMCTATPLRAATTALAIMPGTHLFLSKAVERRRVNLSTEYPAMFVGDPLLALSTGIATRVAGPEAVSRSAPLRRPLGPVIACGALAFGAWQLRDEVRRGRYSRRQALSPSKLWHQFVVYPTMCPLVSGTVVAATLAATGPEATARDRAGAMVAWAGVAGWAFLVVEAMRRPREGHGAFDWRALRSV